MNNNISKNTGKIPNEINKKTSPHKSFCSPQKSFIDGGSGTTEFSLDQQTPSSKKQISSTGKLKISKKGLSSKHSASESYETENDRFKCDKCGALKDSVIKTLSNLKQYVDSINENINVVYHKTNNKKKLSQNNFYSNDFFQFYAEIDRLNCGSNLSNNIRGLMKALKILSDKYDYILNKQEYYEKVVSTFVNIKSSNKDDDFSRINKELLTSVENVTKESYDMPELFKKYNASKEAAEKLIKELKSSLNENSLKNEDKIIAKDVEINLDYFDQFKENHLKNEYFRLQKENVSLRMELNLIYEQMREDNKIFEIKENPNVRKNSKDFSQISKRKNSHSNLGLYSQIGSNNNQQIVNPNPALFIKLKNENTEEIYVHYKNFINRLRMSEFL